jgi:CheY-like chemotaxis protein
MKVVPRLSVRSIRLMSADSLTLPQAQVSASEPGPRCVGALFAFEPGMQPGPCVLVVDDDELVRHVLAEYVGRHGYRVIEAGDGQEAWQRVLLERPDVIVSDLQMPRCDGAELTRRIRNSPQTCDIPLLIVTGSPDASILRRLGCDGVLTKPITPQQLVEAIERIVSRSGEPEHSSRAHPTLKAM